MKVKVFNCILTYDKSKKNTVVLSTSSDQIKLPMLEITYPQNIDSEIRYWTQNLFDDADLKYVELIEISVLELYNKFLLDYVKSIDSYNYSPEQDLCIFSGILMSAKHNTSYHWVPIDQSLNLSDIKPVNLLLDHIIKNIAL